MHSMMQRRARRSPPRCCGVWRDELGASTVEWVGLIAALGVLFGAVALAIGGHGVPVADQLARVIQCHLAAFVGGGGGGCTAGGAIAGAGGAAGGGLPSGAVPGMLALGGTVLLAGVLPGILARSPLANAAGNFGNWLSGGTGGAAGNVRIWLSGGVAGWYGGLFGELVPRLLGTARTYANNIPASLRGFIHEDLWQTFHNASPWKLLRDGFAIRDSVRNTAAWDGWIYNLGRTLRVQLKSVDPGIRTLRETLRRLAGSASNFGANERMLVTSEVADDVVRQTTAAGRAGSSGVSAAESGTLGELARDAARGSRGAFAGLSTRVALQGARRAGVVGAVISAGLSLWQNGSDLLNGRIDKQTAAGRTAVDIAGGAISAAGGALAGAWAGAAAGAAVGTVVPGAGNIVGAIVGFGVGLAIGFGIQAGWDKYVRQPVSDWLSRQLKRFWH